MGTEFILGVLKCSKIDSDDGHTIEKLLKTTELYTLNG